MNEEELIRKNAEDERDEVIDFLVRLNNIGIFPRAYDSESSNLYEAAKVIHKHLCALDSGYYTPTREVKLREFANAYAEVHNGLRKLA